MQLFHASRVLFLAAGLGVGSTASAAFIMGPDVAEAGNAPATIDFRQVIAGARPGGSFDSTIVITNEAGEESGVVRLAGTISPDGIVTFQASLQNNTDNPLPFAAVFSSDPFDVQSPLARAYSVASVVDVNGDGATMAGDHPDGAMVEFAYIPGPDASVAPLFDTQLLSDLTAGDFSTASASDESSPAPTFLPIAARVLTLNASVKFTLSPHDLGQVQGTFLVFVPSPGAVALTGLAGLTMVRRRRTI